jgi:hypothetical protein
VLVGSEGQADEVFPVFRGAGPPLPVELCRFWGVCVAFLPVFGFFMPFFRAVICFRKIALRFKRIEP